MLDLQMIVVVHYTCGLGLFIFPMFFSEEIHKSVGIPPFLSKQYPMYETTQLDSSYNKCYFHLIIFYLHFNMKITTYAIP